MKYEEYEAMRPSGLWHPIATCPQMRTVLLFAVTDRAEDGSIRNWRMATGSYETGYDDERSKAQHLTPWRWDGYKLKTYDHLPTHWMPMPSPPTEQPPSVDAVDPVDGIGQKGPRA